MRSRWHETLKPTEGVCRHQGVPLPGKRRHVVDLYRIEEVQLLHLPNETGQYSRSIIAQLDHTGHKPRAVLDVAGSTIEDGEDGLGHGGADQGSFCSRELVCFVDFLHLQQDGRGKQVLGPRLGAVRCVPVVKRHGGCSGG